MSKTLEKLFNKAMKTGYANLNGRMRSWGFRKQVHDEL